MSNLSMPRPLTLADVREDEAAFEIELGTAMSSALRWAVLAWYGCVAAVVLAVAISFLGGVSGGPAVPPQPTPYPTAGILVQ